MSYLFLSLHVPGVDPTTDDPDDVADRLVEQINGDTKPIDGVMVSGIPAPQWLTPDTLANLRANATAKATDTPHPLAIDLVEYIDSAPAEYRPLLAHVVTCGPCRQGVFNIIQSAQNWPDLYGGPHD